MGSNYQKNLYNQLPDSLEAEDKQTAQIDVDKSVESLLATIKSLESCCAFLEKQHVEDETRHAEDEKEKAELRATIEKLQKTITTLENDNERMKRILNNNSTNSSLPPSTDENRPTRAANTYNGRDKNPNRKAGAQKGHPGKGLTKEKVKEKIRSGEFKHSVVNIGTPTGEYKVRYRIDLEINAVATEFRIYADENGKFNIPKDLIPEVTYGETVKAAAVYLYSEGVVANDRIADAINSLSNGALEISEGSIYNFCMEASQKCSPICDELENEALNAPVVCTDATTVTTNGKQTYIRNFSTPNTVIYHSSDRKNLKTLSKDTFLKRYNGVLEHDHETAMYHFGNGHGECNVHVNRYLKKNSEETGNSWSADMQKFFTRADHERNEQMRAGKTSFTPEEIANYSRCYDDILKLGRRQNKHTKGITAKQEENALLNRLEKYKENHLLFLYDFRVPFSNNMSEQDLRIAKDRDKMGPFRKESGREMYCRIASIVRTAKRRNCKVLDTIKNVIAGRPVFA